ncbi:hypothetical protein PInf_017234 [Phytophthora infestans]|nr:hypothetical protein PInf_017234 [Phytophthora infestans]
MTELKKQKEHLETELGSLRSALEEAEDAQFDAQESLKKQQKQAALHLMSKICETWSQVQAQHGEMSQTLTNYKRDELVAHRNSSAILSNEISIVMKQLEEVEEMKITLERDVNSLQAEAQTIEASLRDLMLQSGNNGSLNMAVVAKKRRLNEEFEALLERIEKKKAEIRNVDQTLASLRARREEKEHEMRAMERKLVEILVQQQKQMLQLVSAVREVSLPIIAS